MENRKDIQFEKLIPTPAKLDGVEEVAVFGDDAEMEPAPTVHGPLARVIVDIPTADFDAHLLASSLLFIVVTEVNVTDLSSV